MANASRSPARSGCAASPRTLPAMLSHSCGLAAPTVCGLFHPAHSTSCCDLPDPVRWLVSAEQYSCSALLLRCYSFSLPVSFDLCFQAPQITWELTASRRRPAFSSHLFSSVDLRIVRHRGGLCRSGICGVNAPQLCSQRQAHFFFNSEAQFKTTFTCVAFVSASGSFMQTIFCPLL